MRADLQDFCKFKVASRIDIFILQSLINTYLYKNVSADSDSLAASASLQNVNGQLRQRQPKLTLTTKSI